MKKNVLIISLVFLILSLTTFGFIRSNNLGTDGEEDTVMASVAHDKQVIRNIKYKSAPSFLFEVGTQFNSIKKQDLIKVKSFADFIGQEHANRIVSYKSLSVIVLENSDQTDIKLTTDSGIFSTAQLELLKSFDYSTNLLIWADYTEKNKETGELEDSSWTPYLTIVPETQAYFTPYLTIEPITQDSYIKKSEDAIINYLEENSRIETANIEQDQLKPGKIFFTVSKKGLISNVEIKSTSGFPIIDEKIKDLISNLPGKWQSAINASGNKVDQILVISYGNMGC